MNKTYTKDEIIKLVKEARHRFWKHLNEDNSQAIEEGKEYVMPKDSTEMLIDEIMRLLEK